MLGQNLLAGLTAAGEATAEVYAEVAPVQPDRSPARLEARYTNDRSAFLDAAGARVHYRDEGPRDAPVVLALHGMCSSLHTWEGWVDALADSVRIVRLDLPGFGLTGPSDASEYSLSYYVEALVEFCEALGIDRVIPAGNSLGGAIAWRFAATHPERVEGLILLNSDRQEVVPAEAEAFAIPGLDVAARYATPRSALRTVLRDAYGDPSALTAARVRRYHDLVLRAGNRRATLKVLRDAAPADVTPRDVTCRTLVQWGEADDWLPVSLGERLTAEIPDATMRTYPGVGHVPMEEAPRETAADVATFLDGVYQ